jgi:hypothetical protein
MRHFVLGLVFAAITLPSFAAEKITVEQLTQLLYGPDAKQDSKLTQKLAQSDLTERLSATRLAQLQASAPGPESKDSLTVLAHLSEFLDLPATEIPRTDVPDVATQRKMLALTVAYTTKTVHQLPNFSATKSTTNFEDRAQGRRSDGFLVPYLPLHQVHTSSTNLLFKDGNEVVDPASVGATKAEPVDHGLIITGLFGPILGIVLMDAAQSKLEWAHWEPGAAGPIAVFRFVVGQAKSHYKVRFCCSQFLEGNHVFQATAAYHGEMGIDPESGAVIRLVVIADLGANSIVKQSNLLVDYSPVDIAGKPCVLPSRSITVTQAPTYTFGVGTIAPNNGILLDKTGIPSTIPQTLMNEVTYSKYQP